MINAELGHVATVEEFHNEIVRQQEEAHGEHYCLMHKAIQRYLQECNSYMELGTHQGGSLSAALLAKPRDVYVRDIDLSRYNKFLKPIAEKYCEENGIKLDVKQIDSTSIASTAPVDILMIDSYHHPNHMSKELETHKHFVSKYIIAHDTEIINGRQNDALYQCLAKFAQQEGWEVVEHVKLNVGYTVIKKK
jgi:hypothetical protein